MEQDPAIRSVIAGLGTRLGPDVLKQCRELFITEQNALALRHPPTAIDLTYGPHERNRLDIYGPSGSGRSVPVLVFAHGGGFIRGDKRPPDDPFNAHVGRWAASKGMLGVVINYRLAPESTWPSGGEDVGSVVDWLKDHVHEHGGDPDQIFLMGTSAGAAHISTYLQLRPSTRDVRAAVLMSGLYGVTPMEGSDSQYFGANAAQYAQRASLQNVANSSVPLMIASAELDPPRFKAEFAALLSAVQTTRGRLPRTHIASGHNHYTLAMHLGTRDARLADDVLAFVRECCGQ